MERVIPLPPGKKGGLPSGDEVNELHKILRPVGWTYYPNEMECILTDFVEGKFRSVKLISVRPMPLEVTCWRTFSAERVLMIFSTH